MNKRILIIGLILTVAIGLGVFAYIQTTYFHVVSTKPTGTAGYQDSVEIQFNRPLSTATLKGFQISPAITGEPKINDDEVVFTPNIAYKLGTTYQVTLSQPQSVDGETAKDVSFKFTASYKDFTDQSKSVQQQQISNTDRLQRDNPILNAVPYQNEHFKIDFQLDNGNPPKPYFTVTLYAVLNRPSQYAEYQAQLHQYKAEALKYLSDHGATPDKYSITFSPDPDAPANAGPGTD